MAQESVKIEVSKTIGSVSGEVIRGEKVNAIMTLAHGAGADMHHSFMVALANDLALLGIATLRFNFQYMEQGRNRPDVPPIAHKIIEASITYAHNLFPDAPLFVGGKSFGGRMSSQYLSTTSLPFVKGIVFFGFPLHPSGKPGIERAEHLNSITIPMLFLQGTRDTLATWSLIENVTAALPHAVLYKLEGADHSFKAGKLNLIPVLAHAAGHWIDEVIHSTE